MHERNTSNTIRSCYSPNWNDLTIKPLEIASPWYLPYTREISDLTPPHKHTHISRSQRHPHGNRGHHEDNIVGKHRTELCPTWTDHCLFATVGAIGSQLHPYNTALESRRLDERNPDKSKDTWLISDRYTIMPSIDRFFSHFNRLLRRRNTSTGHSLEFPSTRVIEWDRGFYTSREMTVHVRFSFRLPGIIILTFRWPTNTK